MASPQMKERPSGVVLNTISKGASPESKCPICLDHYKNISYLDVCLHKFCFCCIREWSKNKAECPLCKQPFNSIYHTIKSEDNYQKFDLRPTENGSFGNMAGQRFRYRTTLTGERRPATRRTSSPPDHGVLFEGLRGSVPQRHNRDLHSMLRRLAEERQRREREGRSLRSLHEQQAVKFRRALYRRGVRVQNVEDGGRSRETSAEFFRRNPACLHRLVPWVKRELTVLYGSHGSLANIVQHIIMTLITRHNLDEQPVLHELRPFLLTHTEHFLHEFLSFARSPFNMEAYDQRAVYDLPQAPGEISRSETSVISISEDESDALVSGSQDYGTPSVTLSQAPWDDETPGPSYSSEPSQVLPFHVRDSDSDSSVGEAVESVPHQDRLTDPGTVEEEHSSGSDEDCVIVGYVKPALERTPELVLLSSDSEQSEQNAEPQSPDLSPADTQRNTSSRSREDKSGERHHERQLSGSRNRSSRSTRTHSSSHGREHQLSKKSKHKRRRENESNFHSSYSHYSQRDRSRRCCTETCSSYTSYYRSVHRSRSQSHRRRRSRDRQERRRSRSNSRINSSNRHSRSNSRINSSNRHSRSNSRINSSNRHSRSNSRINSSNRHSRSNSRINSSNRHSRSNSRINSSNRHSRSNSRINSSNRHSRSNSRINSSNRHSRSNSRINSSNRQDRSHSRSNSRINSSNRHSRSNSRINSSNRHSRSNSRINSSNRHSRSNYRINSSNRQDRSHSRSNSRINSSNRQDRSHSRSNSRINSSSHQTSHHDDHGRKKKYKTKHHEEPSRKSSSQLVTDSIDDGAKKKTKKHKKFKRKSRSPSIDDRSEGKHHKKKKKKKKNKKHKRKSREHGSEERVGKNSPVFITIPSDSDEADPSEPSARNISAADSTVTIADRATDSQPLDMEQESAAGAEWSSVCDAGNRPHTD
ncbi:E3 ubiquitin-protein ligase Topors-like [Carassius auratus]|uniref:E3 ubiquitin-protein ligase Topors n=1 Tax=Carassius auratus TaxID=7957 RepID=A0A6P6PZU1_CARAU|nr:E3 ubiquitin-protein ligase Topors-like [Carassius auratus]